MNENVVNERYIVLINELADQYYYLKERIFILRQFAEKGLNQTDEGYLFYMILWDSVIMQTASLVDESDHSISIVSLLKKFYKIYGNEISESKEAKILGMMGFVFPFKSKEKAVQSSFIVKLKVIRNKFGRAHFDESMVLYSIKKQQIYDENNFSIHDILKFLRILEEGLDILFERVNKPFKNSPINVPERALKLIKRFELI